MACSTALAIDGIIACRRLSTIDRGTGRQPTHTPVSLTRPLGLPWLPLTMPAENPSHAAPPGPLPPGILVVRADTVTLPGVKSTTGAETTGGALALPGAPAAGPRVPSALSGGA